MKNDFLSKCNFYGFSGSNILIDLNKLYPNTIQNYTIDDSFDFNTIDSSKINILVFTWSRWFMDYYDEPNEKSIYEKQGFIYTKKFFELVKKLSNKKFLFVIDNVMESSTFITPELVYFLGKFKQIGITNDRLFLVYNNGIDLEGKLVDVNGYKLNTLHFPHFFISTLFELEIKNMVNVEKTKDFLILNRRLGYHKFQLLNAIKNNGLLENSLFTVLSINPDLRDLIISNKMVENDCKELGINNDDFIPITLPNDVGVFGDVIKGDKYLYNLNVDWFHKTKVNMVSETFFDIKSELGDIMFNDIIHITEKTWKPIHIGVPFVIGATNNHVETIRNFGFKTFEDIINEDYDTETNPNKKINKIVNSSIELLKKYNTKEVLDIVEYNFNLFKDIEHKKQIVEKFFLKPFEKLVMRKFSLI
jgi:hypothetical protein